MQTIIYILPELFLSLSIISILMLGVFIKKNFKILNLLVVFSLIFTIALTINQPNELKTQTHLREFALCLLTSSWPLARVGVGSDPLRLTPIRRLE